MEPYQSIGKIKRSFGNEGELSITLQITTELANKNKFLFVEIDDIFVPFKIERLEKIRGQTIVHFCDYTSESKIHFLLGKTLYTNQPVAQPKGKVDDLSCFIGFTFTDKTSKTSGTITNYYNYANNPLWGATINNIAEEILVPCVEEFILSIDIQKKHIYFQLPEGLIGL